MEEKRKFVRLKRDVNIRWTKADEAQETAAQAQDITMDISEGGICLITYEELPIGKELNLEMELPTGKTIFSKAKVSWVREFEIIGEKTEKGYEVGVQFVDISPSDREEISRFRTQEQ